MTPLLVCALCLAQPSAPRPRLIQTAPAPAELPAAPEAAPEPSSGAGDLLLAGAELLVLTAEPVAGVWVASAKGFSAGRLSLDGLGALGGSIVGGALGFGVGALWALAFCSAFDPALHQGCGPFDQAVGGIVKALGAIIFGVVGMIIGSVLGAPPGAALADRLQGNRFSPGGLGASLGLTVAAGALDAALVADISDRGGALVLPAAALAGLGVLTTAVAGYALVAGH